MAVVLQKTGKSFAELVRVTMNGTTAVDTWSIPAGTLVERVLVVINTAATGTAMNLTVGDDDDADGFIVAADAQGTAGTVLGDLVAEVGAYMKGACGATSGYDFIPKYYASAKTLKIVGSAAGTGGTMDVIVIGKRFDAAQ